MIAARRDAPVRQVIVWQTLPVNAPAPPDAEHDRILKALRGIDPAWKTAGVETFHMRFHWWWGEIRTCRRTEYVRP